MIGSWINIRKTVFDLDRNPTDGKKQIDEETLEELHRFAKSAGAEKIGLSSVPQEWVFKDTAIRYTTDTSPINKRKWRTIPAKIQDRNILAELPPEDAGIYFLTATDSRGAVSSELVFAN